MSNYIAKIKTTITSKKPYLAGNCFYLEIQSVSFIWGLTYWYAQHQKYRSSHFLLKDHVLLKLVMSVGKSLYEKALFFRETYKCLGLLLTNWTITNTSIGLNIYILFLFERNFWVFLRSFCIDRLFLIDPSLLKHHQLINIDG